MTEDVRQTLTLIVAGRLDADSVDHSRRGVEQRVRQVHNYRHWVRNAAREAVMDEQRMQLDEDSYDPEYIAQVYGEVAEVACAAARLQANEDELDAWML